ncbi:hypothetical protein ACJMK2_017668 [Sinanodonta woodiana]|uniref:Uncharacterized protein n=1 Tax=Sinanodonta woodiana TaxID=1069815 RepID=A0ABD3UE87_SINWO
MYEFIAESFSGARFVAPLTQLIVLNDTSQPCSCSFLSSFAPTNNSYKITIDTCTLKINSTHCCTDPPVCLLGKPGGCIQLQVDTSTKSNTTTRNIIDINSADTKSNTTTRNIIDINSADTKSNTTTRNIIDINSADTKSNTTTRNIIDINSADTKSTAELRQYVNTDMTVKSLDQHSNAGNTIIILPQSCQSNTIMIIFIMIITIGTIVLIIIASVFIIRGNRAILFRLDKSLSREGAALIHIRESDS